MPIGERPGEKSAPDSTSGSIDRNIASTGNVIKAVIALLGLLPSVALITGLIEIPPSLGRLVKAVTVPVSIVAVIVIIAKAEAIRRWSVNRAMTVFGACALAGAAAALTYYLIAERVVFEYMGERMIGPISPSDEIRDILEPWENRYEDALENSGRSDRLQELLGRERTGTVVLMFLMMVVCQLLLVIAMVGSAWKLAVGSLDRSAGDLPARRGED